MADPSGQGLKPAHFTEFIGATEVVPFHKAPFVKVCHEAGQSLADPSSAAKLSRESGSGELALLASIQKRAEKFGGKGVRLGIGDDCALLRIRTGCDLAVTTDLSIEGRHFRLETHSPESVGHRALARGLSDLAAMGAKPVAAFLSLGVPRSLTLPGQKADCWVERFFDGLLALAKEHRVPLAGGDLAESPLTVADIVLTGSVPRGQALLRSGAKAGDLIYVTGSLGGSAAELQALLNPSSTIFAEAGPERVHPHLFPQPRVAQGFWLRKKGIASAAIDLSDGISTDLAHLCQASGVAAEISEAALPIGAGATLEMALHGGEDYELLFCAPASAVLPKKIAGVRITQIGRVTRFKKGKARVALLTAGGPEPLKAGGWQHFTAESKT